MSNYRGSASPFSTLEGNKYKLLSRISLDNIDLVKANDASLKKTLKDIEALQEDLNLVTQLNELSTNLVTSHNQLEEALKELNQQIAKQLVDKQSSESQLLTVELTITSHFLPFNREGVDSLTLIFSTADKRHAWESAFTGAKQRLALSADRRPPPEFLYPLPIRKTRAGLQFTCAAPTLGLNGAGFRDVWVCNSDGYVGQVCVLSLQPEPNVTSCNGVCNARILCVAAVPAAVLSPGLATSSGRASLLEETHSSLSGDETGSNSARASSTSTCTLPAFSSTGSLTPTPTPSHGSGRVTPTKPAGSKVGSPPMQPPISQFQLDSDSSDDEDEVSPDEEASTSSTGRSVPTSGLGSSPPEPPLSPVDSVHSNEAASDVNQPTMWLGTEDGW